MTGLRLFKYEKMEKKRQQVVAYIRTASTEVQDPSMAIERQKEQIELFCRNENLELKRIFWDCSSKQIYQRKGWIKLKEYLAVNLGLINFLICTEDAQISNDASIVAKEKEILKRKYGIKLRYLQDKSFFKSIGNIKTSSKCFRGK